MMRSGQSRFDLIAAVVVWIGIIAACVYFSNRSHTTDGDAVKLMTREAVLRERAAAAAAQNGSRSRQTLEAAMQANLVSATIHGGGPTSASLTLSNRSTEALVVAVEAGSVIMTSDPNLPDMVVNQNVEIALEAGEHEVTRALDVRSLEMQFTAAGPDDLLLYAGRRDALSQVLKLTENPSYQQTDPRLQQFAIWIVTNNPTPRGFVGDGVNAVGDTPDAVELRNIERTFRDAGLSPREYRAFAELTAATSQKPAVPKVRLELREAIIRKKIKASARGGGLSSVSLTIELTDDESEVSLEIVIEAGTVFASSDPAKQNMMASTEVVREVTSQRPKCSISISVCCMNMHRNEPGASDVLTIVAQKSEDLVKLAANKKFQSASDRVQQFAVWTVTDNPKRGGYVGIGSFGFGSGPSDKELDSIRDHFKDAGIDPQKFQAFGGPDPKAAEAKAKQAKQEKQDAEAQRRFQLIAVTATDVGTPVYGVMFASPSAANLTEKDLEDIGRSVKQVPRAIVWFYLPGMNAATQKPWAIVTFKSSRTNTTIHPERRPK